MKRLLSLFLISIFAFNVFALEVYKNGVTASYYGEDFHGKKTSSGETFDMAGYTCAHKELPFDTILKVTNLANGKNVQVRVNDRGPFVTTREIDLSKAAAVKLGMIGTGTAKVKIEIVERGPDTKISLATAKSAKEIMAKLNGGSSASSAAKTTNTESKATAKKTYSPGKLWDVQIASFKQKDNATAMAQKLLDDGFENIVFQSNGELHRVVLSKIPSDELLSILDELDAKGYADYLVKERKKK